MTTFDTEARSLPPPPLDPERATARTRVEAKRKFVSDVVAYVVVNAFLVGIWALSGGGYFWPAWVLAGWGVALVIDAWEKLVRAPVTEADVEAELERQRRRSSTPPVGHW